MTADELKELMYGFAAEKEDGYERQLASLDKDSKTERKALTIQKNMAKNCALFPKNHFGGRYYEVRENIVFRHIPDNIFSGYEEQYNILGGEEKKLFLVFAYPMLLVMNTFYLPRVETVNSETDTAKVFEAKLIEGTVGEILREWQRYWNEYGCFECEVIK